MFCFLWKPKVNYRFDKHQALDYVPKQTNSVHALLVKITFNIIHPLTLIIYNWSNSVTVCAEKACTSRLCHAHT